MQQVRMIQILGLVFIAVGLIFPNVLAISLATLVACPECPGGYYYTGTQYRYENKCVPANSYEGISTIEPPDIFLPKNPCWIYINEGPLNPYGPDTYDPPIVVVTTSTTTIGSITATVSVTQTVTTIAITSTTATDQITSTTTSTTVVAVGDRPKFSLLLPLGVVTVATGFLVGRKGKQA